MRYITISILLLVALTIFAQNEIPTPEDIEQQFIEALNEQNEEKIEELITIIEDNYPENAKLAELILNYYLFTSKDKFISKVDEMIEFHPEDPSWLIYKAQAIFSGSDPNTLKQAEDLLIKAEEIAPEELTSYYVHGYLKMNQNDYPKAQEYLLKAIELNETKDTLNKSTLAEINYNLACTYAVDNDLETAVVYLAKAFKINPAFSSYSQKDPDLSALQEYEPYQKLVENYLQKTDVDEYLPTNPIGEPAYDFELMDTEGNSHKLTDYNNKVVLLNFWATWCPPCRTEIPALSEIYEENKDKAFIIIGISVDDPEEMSDEELKKISDELGMNYLILRGGQEIADIYLKSSQYAIPQTYIIDKDGIVVDFVVGSRDKATFESMIEPYL
jgi:peroxiredoxin